MKKEFIAEVVGHGSFVPDPKNDPDRKGVLVKVNVGSLSPAMGKARSCTFAIAKEDLDEFPLWRSLRITVTDGQQHIEFPKRAKPDNGQGEMAIVPPAGGARGKDAGPEPEVTH